MTPKQFIKHKWKLGEEVWIIRFNYICIRLQKTGHLVDSKYPKDIVERKVGCIVQTSGGECLPAFMYEGEAFYRTPFPYEIYLKKEDAEKSLNKMLKEKYWQAEYKRFTDILQQKMSECRSTITDLEAIHHKCLNYLREYDNIKDDNFPIVRLSDCLVPRDLLPFNTCIPTFLHDEKL